MRNKFHGLVRPQYCISVPDVPSLQDVLWLAINEQQIAQPLLNNSIQMLWADDGKLARKVISRSKMRSTYKFPSSKMGCMIYCESKIEYNAARILESLACVISFKEQSVEINYIDANSQFRKHFPDFYVVMSNGNKLLLEVKSDDEALDVDVIERTRILHKELKLHGITYLLISESQINACLVHFMNGEPT